MVQGNKSGFGTKFTTSIEASHGVTTGISAADRAHTIRVASSPDAKETDIVQPGHIFPLMAEEGGVLVRAGHTEASCDLSRMAGFAEVAVICEIMKDDGTMARLPDLRQFAQLHNVKVGTIADLIAHRRRTESIVERSVDTMLDSKYGGDWRMIVYTNKVTYAEHIALIKGDITTSDPVLVRMHALNVMEDVLGDRSGSREGAEVQIAMAKIAEERRGVVVMIREPTPTALSDRVRQMLKAQAEGRRHENELREYGIGAQILLDLGISNMILLTNSQRTVVGLEGYGLSIVGRRNTRLKKDLTKS